MRQQKAWRELDATEILFNNLICVIKTVPRPDQEAIRYLREATDIVMEEVEASAGQRREDCGIGKTEPTKAEVARSEQFRALRDTLTRAGWSAIRLASAIDASPSSILNWTAPPGSLQWRPVPEAKLTKLRIHAFEEARQSLADIRRLFPEVEQLKGRDLVFAEGSRRNTAKTTLPKDTIES